MKLSEHKLTIGLVILLVLILGCVCIAYTMIPGDKASGTAPTSTPKPRAECVPQVFEGEGTDVLELPFTLAGCTKVRMDYVGESNFIIESHDVDNEYVGLLANEIGTWSGTVKWDARAASLAVQSSGRWKIEVME